MFAPLALALSLTASAADPRLDLGVHAFSGVASGNDTDGPMVPALVGATALLWATPSVGVGLRGAFGSYGPRQNDDANGFLSVEGRYRVTDTFTAGLDLGVSLLQIEYFCIQAPCPSSPWSAPQPVLAMDATRELTAGPLVFPLSARVEASPVRWALGLEVGAIWRRSR